MAVGDILGSLKNSVSSIYNNFFYSGRQAPRRQTQEAYREERDAERARQPYVQQPAAPQWSGQQQAMGYQQSYGQQPYSQQPYMQQAPAMGPQSAYQQPYAQQPYAQSAMYSAQQPYSQQQAPAQQPTQQPVQQPKAAPQGRGRRMQMHFGRQDSGKVVNFEAYQQGAERAGAQPAEEPVQEAPQQAGSLLSARVINARGMGDCRSAITLLRNGDAVVIVMEGIADPTEMRRLVDTLSGACYSLTASITKVSRSGVYLLAPQTLAVFADQATNMMNSASVKAQPRNYQPLHTAGQRVSYAPQQQAQPQQQPYGGAQGFTQRAAEPEEPRQSFYQRPAPQAAQTPAFSAQPAASGYAPDEMQAMAQ